MYESNFCRQGVFAEGNHERELGGIVVKILVVEDEELTREGIRNIIPWESLGISEVYMAEDGEEGLNKALEIMPDIIMADVRMPRLDGISMAFEIRKKLQYCKFVFISGYCDKEFLKSAISLSAVDYIEKPIEPEEIIKAVKKAMIRVKDDQRRKELEEQYRAEYKGVLEEIPEEDLVPASWKGSMQLADKIEKYIQDNFSNVNMSLTLLADHFGITKQYMCWLFKKEKHQTINQCIISVRLKWAKEYMYRNHNVKVKQVAEKAGFIDSGYFSKIYKRYEKITPAEYLQKCNEMKI